MRDIRKIKKDIIVIFFFVLIIFFGTTCGKRYKRIVPEGKKFFTNSIGMKFVYIPPGSFMMGSSSGELRHDSDETSHRVILTRGFYIQTTEVTQGQWETVMGTRPWSGKDWVRGNTDHPAVYVSWNDCQEFIGRLNRKEGTSTYRLPTEAEWEYACRAGSTTRYSFGNSDSVLGAYAVYKENAWGVGEKYAHRVGSKRPNAWGLYDVHGNVWEWCRDHCDWKDKVVTGTYRDGITDPVSTTGPARVIRGGSWSVSADLCMSANRYYSWPDDRASTLGFRITRAP